MRADQGVRQRKPRQHKVALGAGLAIAPRILGREALQIRKSLHGMWVALLLVHKNFSANHCDAA